MPFCTSCGTQYDEGTKFCPNCGASTAEGTEKQTNDTNTEQNAQQNTYQQPVNPQPAYQQSTSDNSKTYAILAVVFNILFFLPLVTNPKTEFGKFWANQSLLLLLLGIIGNITKAIYIGYVIAVVGFVFWIMALVSVCKGEMKPLPLIGGIQIIK